MKRVIHHDIYVGTVMFIGAILMYSKTFTMPIGAARFPRLLFYLFAAFSLWIIFQGVKQTKAINSGESSATEVLTFSGIKLPLLSFIIVTIYTVLMKYLGFFLATPIFIVAFMIFYHHKSWKAMLLTIIGVSIFVYILFVKQLHVPFPTGIFF